MYAFVPLALDGHDGSGESAGRIMGETHLAIDERIENLSIIIH